MAERLQKLMAQAGIASRRDAEAIITQGRVTVNGQKASLGDKADPAVDDVRVDGARLRIEAERMYIVLNKPMGIVTTISAQSQEHRRTVRDLVSVPGHLYPVGRLDADSEGLILLTSDCELAQKLTHPRYQHPKVYEVGLTGVVPDEALDIWRRGVVLDDGPTKPVEIKVLTRDKDMTWIRVTMREGRKRQIRRIANTLGYPVRRLIRVQLDTLLLGTLKTGEWRYLSEIEIKALQSSAASSRHHGKTVPESKRPRSRSAPPARKAPAASRAGGSSRGTRRSASGKSGKPGAAPRSRRPSTTRRTNRPTASSSSSSRRSQGSRHERSR